MMRLGRRRRSAAAAGGGGGGYDPAVLSLTGWWRDYAGSSPWAGTASAGGSGSRALTEATNPPTAGSALNGYGVAAFARASSQKMANATAISSFVTASAWSAWALVRVTDVVTDSAPAAGYENEAIVGDSGSYWACCLRSTGPKAMAYQYGATAYASEATFATGAWALLQFRYNGSITQSRVNGGAWADSAAATDIGVTTGTLKIGNNWNGTAFVNLSIADLALINSALLDADFDNVKSYVNSRYALSL